MPKGPITWTDDDVMAQLEAKDKEIERLQELLALPEPPNDGKTHWENCWKDRGHHNCAVAEIERLREVATQLEAALREIIRGDMPYATYSGSQCVEIAEQALGEKE